jgi:hypothetical protein
MPDRRAVGRWPLLTVCVLLASCAARPPAGPGTPVASGTASCPPTTLRLSFISHADAQERARIEASAARLGRLLASARFVEACGARDMNRTGGRTSAAVCRHLACAGEQALKVGLYHDPAMPTLAFEKRGAVFLNAAKSRAGTPANLAHEFAHVLGYTHATWWGWRREGSVPYVVAEVIQALDEAAEPSMIPHTDE